MVTQPTEMLLMSANEIKKLVSLTADAYHIHTVDDLGSAMVKLKDNTYDLIILDDELFSSDVIGVVQEIKRRVPLVPLLVLSNSTDGTYRTDLMEAGADDFLTYGLPSEELRRRLRLILKQRRQNKALARRNQNLHAINQLSRRLHSATHPQNLIADTINLAINTFKLYGVAIVLSEGDGMRIYAGNGENTKAPIYENNSQAHQYDPFLRVFRSGIVQIFQDINTDPYYTPIPVLPSSKSAIIVPLNYQEYTIGVMGIFGTKEDPLNHDDLVIYELFAGQFTVALQNVRHYHNQTINVQSSRHLLRALQRFITLQSADEIAKALREMIEEIPNVGQGLVWLYPNEMLEDGGQLIIDARPAVAEVFAELNTHGWIDKLIEHFNEGLKPITLLLGRGPSDPLGPLFKALRAQQLMMLPITDSARLAGCVIVSTADTRRFGIEEANLMESLARAAGQALERITLIADTKEKSGRLEAILRSIFEGIFFVDEENKVAFCNPQLTELTGIAPNEILGRDPAILLELLADHAEDSDRVRAQLHDAIAFLSDTGARIEDYPIVEATLDNPRRDIHIEFVLIGDLGAHNKTWAGIIYNDMRFKNTNSNQSILLEIIRERIRLPFAQARSLMSTLVDQHTQFTNRERDRMLRQIDGNLGTLGELWDNLLEVYNLEATDMIMNPEETDLREVVQRVLSARTVNDNRYRVEINLPERLPEVNVDELRIKQALTKVLEYALNTSAPNARIQLTVGSRANTAFISILDSSRVLPPDVVALLFDPFERDVVAAGDETGGLGLYLASELVRRNGGHLWAESNPNQGTIFTIELPTQFVAVDSFYEEDVPTFDEEDVLEIEPALPRGMNRVPIRELQTIMLVKGKSSLMSLLQKKLETQEYELLDYDDGEGALEDIDQVRLDLVVIDADLYDMDSLNLVKAIREKSELPIILIADKPSEPQQIRALNLGADEYLTKPISEAELMARVKVIAERIRIKDRARQPLDLGELYIDFARREVFLSNKPVSLTRIEYELLCALATNLGQVLTHKQLLQKVWGPEYQGETQYLWVSVSRLRKKLEPTRDSPRYIHTQSGIGYMFRKP